MKRCADCGDIKPSSEYHANVRRPDGLAFYCKPCAATRSERSRKRRGIAPRRECPEVLMQGMKWCPDWEAVKDIGEFPRNKNTKTRRAPYCKPSRATFAPPHRLSCRNRPDHRRIGPRVGFAPRDLAG